MILVHLYLLSDYPALLLNRFGREIGRRHEVEKYSERLIEAVGAGEQIGGHIVRGIGVRVCAESCETGEGVLAVRILEELVLEIMCDPVGNRREILISGEPESVVDRAVARREDRVGGGQLFRKYADLKSAFMPEAVIFLAQEFIPFRRVLSRHMPHLPPEFRSGSKSCRPRAFLTRRSPHRG